MCLRDVHHGSVKKLLLTIEAVVIVGCMIAGIAIGLLNLARLIGSMFL